MIYKRLLYIGGVIVSFLPLTTFAALSYTPLVNIPGVSDTNDFNKYLNAIYALSISVAALIAVVKIIIAGAKYMLDDIVTHKSEAKEEIQSSLIGLLIIIGAVLILNTINSDLTHMTLFDSSKQQIINDAGTPPPFSAEKFCADLVKNGGECNQTPISDLKSRYNFLVNPDDNPDIGDKFVCDALNGYISGGCNFSDEALQRQLNLYLKNIANNKNIVGVDIGANYCTTGIDTCHAGYCADPLYSNEMIGRDLGGCEHQCTSTRHGQYVASSSACVFTGDIYLTTRECSQHSDFFWKPAGVGGFFGGTCEKFSSSLEIACEVQVNKIQDCAKCSTTHDVTTFVCSSAEADCEGRGGTSLKNDSGSQITCYLP